MSLEFWFLLARADKNSTRSSLDLSFCCKQKRESRQPWFSNLNPGKENNEKVNNKKYRSIIPENYIVSKKLVPLLTSIVGLKMKSLKLRLNEAVQSFTFFFLFVRVKPNPLSQNGITNKQIMILDDEVIHISQLFKYKRHLLK